jgi:hypothetical protein
MIQEKTEELGENPVPVSLCPLKIKHGLARVSVGAETNRLHHGKAHKWY